MTLKIKNEPKNEFKNENKPLKPDNKKKLKKNKKNPKKNQQNINNSNNNKPSGSFNNNPQHGQLDYTQMPNLQVDGDSDVELISSQSHQGKINTGYVKKEHFDTKTAKWKLDNDSDVEILDKSQILGREFKGG